AGRRTVWSALGAPSRLAAVLGACCGDEEEPAGGARVASTLGRGEGALTRVTLPGSVESGTSDPRVDWVTPFEERTGCKVGLKVVQTPAEMADLMRAENRRYDGLAAPPEVAGQLIAEKRGTPVNTHDVDGCTELGPSLRRLNS